VWHVPFLKTSQFKHFMSIKAISQNRLLSSVIIFSLPFLPFNGFFENKEKYKSTQVDEVSDLDLSKTVVPSLIAPGTHIGMWVWQSKYINDPWERILMLDFCRSHGIESIFLQVHFKQTENGDYCLAEPKALNDLLFMANALGIRVEALDGSGDMAFRDNHANTISRLRTVLDFNASQPPEAQFSGIHYDIEPYTTPRWIDGEHQEVAVELLEVLSKLREITTESDPSLTFANDIPFWYDGDEKYLIEFNGKEKYLNEHIQDISDFIGIMSYRTKMTGKNSTAEITSGELAYGTEIDQRVYLSIETVELPDTPQITFYGKSPVDVALAVRELSNSLENNSSYGGVFLHEYETLRLISDQWDLSEIN